MSDQDLDLAGMRRTVRNFLEKLEGADMALFSIPDTAYDIRIGRKGCSIGTDWFLAK